MESKNNTCHSKEESQWNSCDSDDLCADSTVGGEKEDCKKAKKSKKKQQGENEVDAPYPEPRLPYPCLSALSSKEHKMYLDVLLSKNTRVPPQVPAVAPKLYFHFPSPCFTACLNVPL